MAAQDYGAPKEGGYDPSIEYGEVIRMFFDDGFSHACCEVVREAFWQWAEEVGLSESHRAAAVKHGIGFPEHAAVFITRDEVGLVKEVA